MNMPAEQESPRAGGVSPLYAGGRKPATCPYKTPCSYDCPKRDKQKEIQ